MTSGDETRRAGTLRRSLLAWAVAPVLLAAACDDSDTDEVTDSGVEIDEDAGTDERSEDAGEGDIDAGEGDIDAGIDAGETEGDAGDSDAGEDPEPVVVGDGSPTAVQLSLAGHDRLFGLTYDSEGNLYATGQIADSTEADADYSIVVAKFLASGELDSNFGTAGVASLNVAEGGKGAELGRGIVVQSSGKIVVLGQAEHDPNAAGVLANDTDVVLVRFKADGTLDDATGDDEFGTAGIVRLDLGTGFETTNNQNQPAIGGADAPWSLGLAAEDKLVIHAAARAEGNQAGTDTPRTDTDWVLVRLDADGDLDDSFGTDGRVDLDIAEAGASARSATVLADGSVVGSGYTTSNVLLGGGATTTQQPVIYKVKPDGSFDGAFATPDMWSEDGVYYDLTVAPPARAEAYGAAPQGDMFVTMGYGSQDGTSPSDWVSFRFTSDGQLDTSYGTDGATWVDIGGYGDNGRAVLVLPDQRVLGIGSGRPAPAEPPAMGVNPPQDATLVLLTEDGQPDSTFGEGGVRTYDLGGASDVFWGGALSPDGKQLALVGVKGGVTDGNDDAALLLLPLE